MKIMTNEVISNLIKSGVCSIDAEHDPKAFIQDSDFDLWGAGLSYLVDGKIVTHWLTERDDIQTALDVVCDNDLKMVCHFGQADITMFLGANYTFKKDPDVRCTAIAYNMLNENRSQSELGLKGGLLPRILKRTRAGFMECAANGPETDVFIQYAKDDVYDQLELYMIAEKALKEQNLYEVYKLVTKSIVPFSDMIYEGMPFSMENAEELYHKFTTLEEELEHAIYGAIGYIDLGSSAQLANRLFKQLRYSHKMDKMKKTKTGYSTGIENLKILAEKYEAAELLVAWRTCSKMKSTYIDPFCEQAERYGRVFDNWFLTSTTGRTKTKRFQLIPNGLGKNIKHNTTVKAAFSDLKLRKMIKAEEGHDLVVVDFSSLEYRTAAVASNDQKLINMYQAYKCSACGESGKSNKPIYCCPKCNAVEEFKHGEDLHSFMRDVSNRYGAGIDRSQAKGVSFCIVFGGGAWKLSQMLGLDERTCEKIMRALLDEFSGIEKWQKDMERKTKQGNKVETRDFFGRRRQIDIQERIAKDPYGNANNVRNKAKNELINFECQSPGCIICQIALRKTRQTLKDKGLWDMPDGRKGGRIVSMVHDELVLHAPSEIAEQVLEVTKDCMGNAITCAVPFNVEGDIAKTYAEAK